MPQRSDQRARDSVADDVSSLLDDEKSSEQTGSESSFAQRAKSRAVGFFSPRVFGLALVLSGLGMLLGSAFIPLPILDNIAGLLGVFVATFVLGLVVERSTVVESAAAGAVVAGAMALLGNLALTAFSGIGVPLAVFGAVTGLLAAAVGAYFGGDLRDGLTADL